MNIEDKTVLVTGANRGIGRALVEEALARGAKRVYAGTRRPLAHPDERVTPQRAIMVRTRRRMIGFRYMTCEEAHKAGRFGI